MSNSTPRVKSTNVKWLPETDESGRQTIADFLEFMHLRTQINLDNHRIAAAQDKSARTIGMIRHLRDRLGTINFLISINEQRRTQDKRNGN